MCFIWLLQAVHSVMLSQDNVLCSLSGKSLRSPVRCSPDGLMVLCMQLVLEEVLCCNA